MRRTGKLYTLTLVSSVLTIFASVMVCFWRDSTSTFHLWIDLVPQGFGMASFITSTLIVSLFVEGPRSFGSDDYRSRP